MEEDDEKFECAECGTLSETVETAQEHAKLFSHTNFILSNESILDIYCRSCSTLCNSHPALRWHMKKTGHKLYEELEAKLKRETEEAIKALIDELAREREEEEERIRIESEKQAMSLTRLLARRSQMRTCLHSIKQSLKFVEQEERALNTLSTIVKNIAEHPDEEKYRRLRIGIIEKRLGYVEHGFRFLELCKFEKIERGEFLFLPRYEVELELLEFAENELNKALSKEEKEKSM